MLFFYFIDNSDNNTKIYTIIHTQRAYNPTIEEKAPMMVVIFGSMVYSLRLKSL